MLFTIRFDRAFSLCHSGEGSATDIAKFAFWGLIIYGWYFSCIYIRYCYIYYANNFECLACISDRILPLFFLCLHLAVITDMQGRCFVLHFQWGSIFKNLPNIGNSYWLTSVASPQRSFPFLDSTLLIHRRHAILILQHHRKHATTSLRNGAAPH